MDDTDNGHLSDLGLGDPRLCIWAIGLFYWRNCHSDVSIIWYFPAQSVGTCKKTYLTYEYYLHIHIGHYFNLI